MCIRDSLGIDKAVHPQSDHNKNASQQIDAQISVRIGKCIFTGTKQVQDRRFKEKTQHGEQDPGNQQQGKRVAHNLFGAGVVAFPPGDGAQRRASHTKKIGESRNDGDDGKGKPQPGQRQGGGVGKMPDIDAVHHIIKDVDQLRQRHRQRQI